MFQKNYKIYSMNAYTCPEYSCKVLIEITLYFELEEKQKLSLLINLDFCLFCTAQIRHTFSEIFIVTLECLYICPYLILDF
jgi:hypothetical protein